MDGPETIDGLTGYLLLLVLLSLAARITQLHNSLKIVKTNRFTFLTKHDRNDIEYFKLIIKINIALLNIIIIF